MEFTKTQGILVLTLIFSASVLVLVNSQDTTGLFYCTDFFCEEKLRLEPCPEKRNCSTVGFRTFLDPSECNCCDYCFDYLKENATCSLSSPQKPVEMCGPYLECKAASVDSDPATCQLIESGPKEDLNFCMSRRKQYMDALEDGSIGIAQFLPDCDSGGNYSPRQCIPGSICYCSSSEGEKLFGQALPSEHQDCACARDVARLQSFGFEGRMPHCLPNGDYDELQCVVRSCFCRSFPNTIHHPQNMTKLPCYDPSIHIYDPETPLFYMRECELKRAKAEIEIAEAELKGTMMIISDIVKCDPDGHYAPIQTQFDRQYCADPMTGGVLEEFEVAKFSPPAAAMNCHCARARYLLRESATGKPRCCKNGNYKPLQHIGSTWFCVDEYGRQIIPTNGGPVEVHEEDLSLLPCYNGGLPTDDC